jgi:hypothetical protein
MTGGHTPRQPLVQLYLYSGTPTADAKLPESKIIGQGRKDIVHEVKKKK